MPRRQHQVDLLVVEPHAVCEQQVRPEHAEIVEVHHRPLAGAREVALGVGRRGREVHRHVRAHLAGEVGRAGEQRVGREVVADERDPALDEAASRVRRRRRRADGRAPRRSGAANGPISMSQPHVPIVPRTPTRASPSRRWSGYATVPASISVVTPFCSDSTAHSSAVISSSCGGVRAVQGNRPLEDATRPVRAGRGCSCARAGRR